MSRFHFVVHLCICSLPFGWLGFPSLALKWLRARTGWGDPGVAWSRVMAKFYLQPPHFTFTFPQIILLPPKCYIMFICSLHISLSLFHTSSCCHHPALLPDHGMPPCDLLPPSAALYGEATWYEFLPPISPPFSLSGANLCAHNLLAIQFKISRLPPRNISLLYSLLRPLHF